MNNKLHELANFKGITSFIEQEFFRYPPNYKRMKEVIAGLGAKMINKLK